METTHRAGSEEALAARADVAREILAAFAERTGLVQDGRATRRYLWTDAFAVCGFLELARLSGEPEHGRTALRLIEEVHRTLGRHRDDDPRTGWISGLPEEEGSAHPTRGGLRIGKPLPERAPGEPLDERFEWDRDGQYFHYLTKWMHALARAARATGEDRYLQWAIELALAAHAAFTRAVPGIGGMGMVWKASIDLSRPLVSSMGHHDPLDGLLTFLELRADAREQLGEREAALLDDAVADMHVICVGKSWTTDDELGLGGLLTDASRLGQLVLGGKAGPGAEPELFSELLRSSLVGLRAIAAQRGFDEPAARRLAFRELGLAIGLRALPAIEEQAASPRLGAVTGALLAELEAFLPLAAAIEGFWLHPASRATASWHAHLDINSVMLATCLVPDGYLTV